MHFMPKRVVTTYSGLYLFSTLKKNSHLGLCYQGWNTCFTYYTWAYSLSFPTYETETLQNFPWKRCGNHENPTTLTIYISIYKHNISYYSICSLYTLLVCCYVKLLLLNGIPVRNNPRAESLGQNPTERLYVVNKAYADRIKYKTATGNIPNTGLLAGRFWWRRNQTGVNVDWLAAG